MRTKSIKFREQVVISIQKSINISQRIILSFSLLYYFFGRKIYTLINIILSYFKSPLEISYLSFNQDDIIVIIQLIILCGFIIYLFEIQHNLFRTLITQPFLICKNDLNPLECICTGLSSRVHPLVQYHAYLELYQILLYEHQIRSSFMNNENIKPFPWYNILYECTNIINNLTTLLENEYEKKNGPILDDYQYSNKITSNSNINLYPKSKLKINNFIPNDDRNFDSYYNNKYNQQYETPYSKMKNINSNRLSTIKLKQYIKDNYPNITPKRVYDYLINTPSINQFKRKLMNTPNQKRDLFNAREEMEYREREYLYHNENNPYFKDYNKRNNYRFNEEYDTSRGMNSFSDYPRRSSYYNYKENITQNNTHDYNMNNVNPYSYFNSNKNINPEYSFHQRNKVDHEPEFYEKDNYPPPNFMYHNDNEPNSCYNNDRDRYHYEKLRKTYNSYDHMKSNYSYQYPSMNNDFQKANPDIEDEFMSMNRFKENSQYESNINDNYRKSNISEGYNKSLKSYVKPITIRTENETSFWESLIKMIVRINNSWRFGKYLFGTSIDRYVSILIQDLSLQQWAIQILGNLVYFSLVEDKQQLIKSDLGNILECLLRLLLSIELFIENPPVPPSKRELPVELDIMISLLQSTLYKITLSYYNEIKQLKFSPRIYKKLQYFLDFKE
ncbi:hypothetical protein BCR36DRAFT_403651 [Piromyces finnis]|uniref:Uncharacterized protein n=1 Tax=Piromyces finnis TaxID=1754191 RepID=A0A1Y1VDI8_9FUNG|nr:hypothetical protein BCR36DRAFT_403651 [Piromyces finnis]|eukprot:ORX53459.1 hypothetical protein BCR36DRAFT_403651 [Piromyces finnis]